MKIALANNLYYPYNRGGAETVIKKMIADLESQGHTVFLITTKPKSIKLKTTTEHLAEESPTSDLKTYHLPSAYYNLGALPAIVRFGWHLTNLFSFRQTRRIKKILTSEQPDLIITHNLMGLGFLLPRTIKKLKIRHEHYLHDIQLLYPTGLMLVGQEKIIDGLSAKIYQFFTRLFFGSPAKIISPSLWLLAQHRQRGFFRDSETIIKNNPLSDSVAPIRKPDKAQNFLFVGQIETHKGVLFLLSAFKEALEVRPEIKLILAGAGSKLEEIKTQTLDNPQIQCRGRLDAREINALMRASDYLILPSLCYENAPTAIYEAHASGLPVLAANLGGIPEIINNNDKLFKAGDISELKNMIIKLS